MTKPLTSTASIPLKDNTTTQQDTAMNNDSQSDPEKEEFKQLLSDIIGVYCTLPDEKRPELITAIEAIRSKNKVSNDEISEHVKRMSPELRSQFLRFIRAVLASDMETLEVLKKEAGIFNSPVTDDFIARMKQGESMRHVMKPIPDELPAVEKLPILLHNISRMRPEECDFVLNILRMGEPEA